jgi:hypothetical protein
MGYEDGRVEVWALPPDQSWRNPSDARTGSSPWEKVYEAKKHNEAGKRSPQAFHLAGRADGQ